MAKKLPGAEVPGTHLENAGRNILANRISYLGKAAGISMAFCTLLGHFLSIQQESTEADYPGISDRVAARASKELHQPLEIRCEDLPDKSSEVRGLGQVEYSFPGGIPSKLIKLDIELCKEVDEWQDVPLYSPEQVINLMVISHETWHTKGVKDEAAAQCYALQTTASELSQSSSVSYLKEIDWIIKDFNSTLNPIYLSPDCHAGSSLDLHLPNGGIWLEN